MRECTHLLVAVNARDRADVSRNLNARLIPSWMETIMMPQAPNKARKTGKNATNLGN
jgi:hypothetical protein